MPYLKFISDEELIDAVGGVLAQLEKAEAGAELNLHKNIIDPFSATFDGTFHGMEYQRWIESEKKRQIQKTLQNAIGEFHQDILGSVPGWEDLGTGEILDVVNRKMKVIAEVKNKFNTTKGNHRVKVYDDIKSCLESHEYKGFTGYFVEIIPKNGHEFNKPFTPSDSSVKGKEKRRPINERIRTIDGKSFYKFVTGREGALGELFEVLPKIMKDKFAYKLPVSELQKYSDLFFKAFGDK